MYIIIGVYHRNLNAIEKCILSINQDAKKSLRNEVLDYIRINTNSSELQVNEQYINFKNGLYDLINQRLIKHSPNYFTTCQINANYIEDKDILVNQDILHFLKQVTCDNYNRMETLLQMIGYCMTFRVDLAVAVLLYGPTAKNRKKYNH